jgi:hypothetical protein
MTMKQQTQRKDKIKRQGRKIFHCLLFYEVDQKRERERDNFILPETI